MTDAPKIAVTKMDAARRQLRTAIRLWFEDADPIATHTLVAAAYEIIHNLFRARGHRESLLFDSHIVKPEFQGSWAKALKSHANFFKHANRDPDEIIEFIPYANDTFILFSLHALSAMKEPLGAEETAFANWTRVNRPEMFENNALEVFPVDLLEYVRSRTKKEFWDAFIPTWNARNSG